MQFIKIIKYLFPLLLSIFLLNCSKDSKHTNEPITPVDPEYSLVFDHGKGELCYYPRLSSNGQYLAIEREEIVSPPGYVAHIWLHDFTSGKSHQLTDNPATGYFDDRNLRFSDGDNMIYFIRTHWLLDGSSSRRLCRIPVNGTENDVEQLPDGGMQIYCFDFLPQDSRLLISYYDNNDLTYSTGFLDLTTGKITLIKSLVGQRHNSLVPLPDGTGFIASTGSSGADLFSYKLTRHYFDSRPSVQYSSPTLKYLVWALSVNPRGECLLVHQGVCTRSMTHTIPLSGGTAIQILTEYSLPRDACWGSDNFIYFTVDGNVMRYGPVD